MKVTSRKTISFPKLNWGINKGETRSLPKDEKAQKIILANSVISKVGETKPTVEGKAGDNKTLETKQ